ncbi:uncharacterized protein LOC134823122 [Bolinopsis microptera]|uniref:uncharacterized protein LOC134823122 n=1 Tax=Bolinopsis microptera TaxID=2820187 RepID=UPI0030796430
MLLSVAIVLYFSQAEFISVEEMRELLVASMQTTLSLTALVEQQTQKKFEASEDRLDNRMNELKLSVIEKSRLVDKAKKDIEDLKIKLATFGGNDGTHRGIEELEGKFAPSEEKLAKDIEAVEKSILEKSIFVEEAKEDIEDKLKILRIMAFLKLMLLSVAIVLVSSKSSAGASSGASAGDEASSGAGAGAGAGAGGTLVSVGELRELLVSSMQTTISLTGLVEQQTQRIFDITNYVNEAERGIEELEGKLAASEERLVKIIQGLKESIFEKSSFIDEAKDDIQDLKSKIATIGEKGEVQKEFEELDGKFAAYEDKFTKDIQALEGSILEKSNFVDEVKDDIQNLKSTIATLGGKEEAQKQFEELEAKFTATQDQLAKDVEALKEANSNPKRSSKKIDVMVVSGEEDLRDDNCAKVCAGTSVRGATNWVDYSTTGIYTNVDISKCGFVTIPTVTTSLEGSTAHWGTTGSSEIYSATATSFTIYLLAPSGQSGGANEMGWNVEWIAVGYTC